MAQPQFKDTGKALVEGVTVAKAGALWVTTVTCRMSSGPFIGQPITIVLNKHKWDTADSMVADILAGLSAIPNDVSIPDGVLGASI